MGNRFRRDAIIEVESKIASAIDKGLEQGREEGSEEGRVETLSEIKACLTEKGFDSAQIHQLLGV